MLFYFERVLRVFILVLERLSCCFCSLGDNPKFLQNDVKKSQKRSFHHSVVVLP